VSHLDRVQEEASELIKAISKYRRFGARPTDPATGIEYDNLSDIKTEMTDLYRRMRETACVLDIPWREIAAEGCFPKPFPEESDLPAILRYN